MFITYANSNLQCQFITWEMKDIDQKKRKISFPKLKFKINFFGHFIHHYTKSFSKQLKVLKGNHSLVFPYHLVGVESCVWPG